MLDKGTFDNSRAAEILATELNKEEMKVQQKVAKLLASYNRKLNAIAQLNSNVAIDIERILFHDVLKRVDVCPERFRTFLVNVIKIKHKKFLTKLEGLKPYKNRADHPNFKNE